MAQTTKYAKNYSEEDVQAAIRTVREKHLSKREAARQHNIPESTLRGRLQGRLSVHKAKPTALSRQEEQKLVEWLKESARRGFGRSKNQLLTAVQTVISQTPGRKTQFRNYRPGYKWYRDFMRRHAEQLSLRTPQALGAQRAAVAPSRRYAMVQDR
ncbi:mushroom body large-type kenyon cell-specific protein 1 [Plakobranchus ocellatus]|uniref:Mushroom body large-type kenyon cell-specific protein 1 n=1 Tax=Plakobranchus ocellatus TaxID=259542 RepID=A0AAV3ZDL2_9GAST|nr:mushroom body large-type kenyon cell-specific protein 1 [Plakobranchus ocellatus]